ncbi:MAG: 3-oxoacyl-[acyl-carrier-protein] synthase III C-terminal domain-containing protein [bacterium]
MRDVFFTKSETFLPNEPVSNEEMEQYLGLINGNESKARGLILRSNKIKSRYYALDRDGNPTHTNAQITAAAIRKLFDKQFGLDDVELLTCGTSSPDTIQPAHALMVQGELGGKSLEVMSAHGTYIAFEKEFLRWMLSDGAAALLLENQPAKNSPSLRIDWVEIKSYANELESCMYAGSQKNEDGSLTGWRELSSDEQNLHSIFSLKQDAKLLQKYIVPTGFRFLKEVLAKHDVSMDTYDYFLPHLSSMFFKDKIYEVMEGSGLKIPLEKWVLNLDRIGNIGSASAFFLIDELFHSGRIRKGERILVMVPESARFSYTYIQLSVV